MNYRILIAVILVSVLIFIVSKTVRLDELWEELKAFPLQNLAILICLSFLMSFLKATRFYMLLRSINIKINFWNNLKAFIASQAISPLPGGETMRGILVTKEVKVPLIKTTGPIITQAFLEIFTAAIITTLGGFIFRVLQIPSFIFLAIMLVILGLLIRKDLVDKIGSLFPDNKYLNKLIKNVDQSHNYIRTTIMGDNHKVPDKVFISCLGLSIVINFLGGVLIFLIGSFFSSNLNLIRSIYTYSAGSVIQGLTTISPGGLGFTEGGMTGILLLSNIEPAKAIGIILIYRVTTLVFNIVLGLLFLSFFYAKTFIKGTKDE